MSEKNKKDGFFGSINKFFKRVDNQDLISLGGENKINIMNSSQTKDDMKQKQELQVFRQYLQNKNWNLKHIEYFDEYRRMDATFPIINAAIRLYSQEVCVTGDTMIRTPAGVISVLDQYKKNSKHFLVESYNSTTGTPFLAECRGVVSNGVKEVYEVEVTRNIDLKRVNGDSVEVAKFKCTNNHKLLLPDNTYKELKDLKVGDQIKGFFDGIDPSCGCPEKIIVATTILSIKSAGEEEVFDLTNVFPSHNFAIKLTDTFFVFVHNCNKDADGDIMKIICDEKEVKASLHECFYDNLKLDSRSYLYVREMLKFGNLFGFLETRRGVGVTDIVALPPEAVRLLLQPNATRLDQFKYLWQGFGGGGLEFDPWEIVHWKVIEDLEQEPYGQCLKGDTRITTESGVKEIALIEKGESIWSYDTNTQTKVLSKILDKVCSGVKMCYRVSTTHNFLDVTAEHKVLICENNQFIYKFVSDLQVGDKLVIDKNVQTNISKNIEKISPKLEKFQNNEWFENYKDNIPDVVTKELAQLYGFMLGDGWIPKHNQSVEIALGIYEDLNNYYINLLEKFAGKKGVIINNASGSKQFKINSKLLKNILIQLGFNGYFDKKRFPDWIFSASPEIQESFIQGLWDADGWETEDEWIKAYHIQLTNEQLVKDFKILLQRLGYKTGQIRIIKSKFGEINGKQFIRKESYTLTYYKTKLQQTKVSDISNRLSDNFILEQIRDIKKIGEFETYDIYVENKNHNFYANGIVVHNSILRSIVDTWRRIVLMREALVIYRITRAPQRFLFKMDTTGLDPDAALRHAESMKRNLTKKPLVNPQTGEIDAKFSPMPIHKDSIIPLLDGRNITIENLALEYQQGKENYVYSIDDKTHEPLPGKVVWCGKNYTAKKLVKVTLDDDTFITTAPEHPFILKNGDHVNAIDLKENMSLMPFYTDLKVIGSNGNKYERTLNNASGKYEFTHRFSAKEFRPKGMEVIHHLNFKSKQNQPTNLLWMKFENHIAMHSELIKMLWKNPEHKAKMIANTIKWNKKRNSVAAMKWYNGSELHKEHNVIRKEAQIKDWADPVKKQARIKTMTAYFDDHIFNEIRLGIINKNIKTQNHATEFVNQTFIDRIKELNPLFKQDKISRELFKRRIQEQGFKDFEDYKTSILKNHKVKSIELIEANDDVYCMTVEGLNGENDRHNFALISQYSDLTYSKSGIYICNSIMEDFYMPTYEGDLSDISILEGASNLDAVEDYKIIKDDLFAGLLIPKSYLSFEEDLCVRYNTVVKTTEGNLTIKEIADLFENSKVKKIYVLSCNEFGLTTNGKIVWCRSTKEVTSLYRVHLSNNKYHDVTDNHPFLLETLLYRRADELKIGDIIRSISDKEIVVSNIEIIDLDVPELVYDLEVEKYHNFALDSGIFVHNSNKAALSQEDLRFNNAVKQYQSYYIEGMLHVALVHLYMNGFGKDELESFSIQMNGSSTLAEKAKNELLQQRIDLAKAALDSSNGISLMSYTQVLKDILKFTDDEIAKTFSDQLIENKMIWRLNQIKENGFYDEPNPDKKKAMMRGLETDVDVFKDLQFESSNQLPRIESVLDKKISNEIKQLTKPNKKFASKKMIDSVISLHEDKIKSNIRKTYLDMGLKTESDGV